MVIYKYGYNFIKNKIVKKVYTNAFETNRGGKNFIIVGNEMIKKENLNKLPDGVNRNVYFSEENDKAVCQFYLDYTVKKLKELEEERDRIYDMQKSIINYKYGCGTNHE